MEEYGYLLFVFMLLHLGVRSGVNYDYDFSDCKFYLRPGGGRKAMRFDLNSLRGLQIMALDVEGPNRGVFMTNRTWYMNRRYMHLMVDICDNLRDNQICKSTGKACIFKSPDDHYQPNAGSTIVLRNGSYDFLQFDMVGAACKTNTSRNFVLHFNIRCKIFDINADTRTTASWAGPNSCEANVFWTVGGFCGYSQDDFACSVNIGHNVTLDLDPLRSSTFLTAADAVANKTYQFNICAPVKQGRCNGTTSLCEIDRATEKAVSLADSIYSYYNRFNGIVISFARKDRGRSKAEIWLRCIPGRSDMGPPHDVYQVFMRKKTKIFLMRTPLGCLVPPPLCIAVNEETGDQFNLYELAGQVLEFDHYESKIVVSVCAPINKEQDVNIPCSGPGLAACLVGGKDVIKVLGMLGQSPEVLSNGAIRLSYYNGDPCLYTGDYNARYSTFLDLYCDKSHVKNSVREEGCSIFINYVTPVACPSMDVIGRDCQIQDPRYNSTIDLNSLRNEKEDITLPLEANLSPSVRFNLCGPLVKSCNGISNTSFCLYKNGSEYAIGGPALFPKYHDAMVKFDLYGPPCDPDRNFTKVTVMLTCNHAAKSLQPSTVQYVSTQACHYYVVWKTDVACPPFTERPACNVQNEKTGEWYDLSALSDPNINHRTQVRLNYGNSSTDVVIFINVCRSVVHGSNSPCPPYSGICMHVPDPNEPEKRDKEIFINLGEAGYTGPILDDDDSLKIQLESGDICGLNKNGKERYSSAITFICDRETKTSAPEYVQDASFLCHFEFRWKTSFACPTSDTYSYAPDEKTNPNKLSCQVLNENTNHSYNLSPLKNKTWVIPAPSEPGSKGHKFYISICDKLPKLGFGYCGYNAGVCMEENKKIHMLGIFSENLQYTGHHLFLTYGGGRLCNGRDFYRSEISFMCSSEFFPRNGPQYVGTVGCKHLFMFYTDLVCEKDSLSCTVDTSIYDEKILSLSSLMQSTAPYRIESSDGHIFIVNVCGPLPRAKNLGCKDGSAACMLQSDTRTISDTPLSLGFPLSRPVLDHLPGKKPQVVWKYSGGDPCPYASKGNATANLRFICDPNVGPGRPKYEGRGDKDCVYHFSWNTSVVCLEEKVEFDRQSCLLTNHATQETFNLTELYPRSYQKDMMAGLKPPLTGESLYIYLCSWPQHWMNETNTVECKDTAVCALIGDMYGNFTGYGYQHFAYYDNSNSTLKIFFRGTYRPSCSDREVSGAEIWFPCAADGRTHKPKLLAATECHLVIEWPSPLMCGKFGHAEEPPTVRTAAWKTMGCLMAIAVVSAAILYLIRKTRFWASVRTRVNRSMGYKHSTLVTYTADPQEEWTEFETLND
ncbi:cation-independent mannose-6-phosphate receptor isoform X2 [Thrips palmi]|uniref:Cation-independent mannose-6-phosphate receptor isoform X2 n=1 Tax=Thrips palmi TaxID=161013 RepID=A0A6P8ZXM2_THRPL|nr:cation-independent mannose-6-phosphate receptor isoform X2 [Thrips palmi]